MSKKLPQTCSCLSQCAINTLIVLVINTLTGLVNINDVSTEELTMEQESEGVDREEEESVCLLYNTLRTHVGW